MDPAPAWRIAHWLNTPEPLTLDLLRGRVVIAVAFQMLCPGCVAHALPQAMRVQATFPKSDVAVVGLHTVFEHYKAQGTSEALEAFLHEYRIGFPVGIDARDGAEAIPATMRLYRMEGTPTTLIYDRLGRLRLQRFGHLDDMGLGAAIASLIAEASPAADAAAEARPQAGCAAEGCRPAP
jgi:hypothetical protein